MNGPLASASHQLALILMIEWFSEAFGLALSELQDSDGMPKSWSNVNIKRWCTVDIESRGSGCTIGPSSERTKTNLKKWRAYARNVRLRFLFRWYTNLFIFRFVSLYTAYTQHIYVMNTLVYALGSFQSHVICLPMQRMVNFSMSRGWRSVACLRRRPWSGLVRHKHEDCQVCFRYIFVSF